MKVQKNSFFCRQVLERREIMIRKKKLLPLKKETINRNGAQNKIELLKCQLEYQKCKEHLSLINENYYVANNYHAEKDYKNSIESLKSAFNITSQLKESPCSTCAIFFRSTITQSLENMNNELRIMTSGIFKKKRYQMVYNESCEILNDFKKNDE